MKNTKKIVSLILAICMLASLAISASAANTVDASGGTGTSSVKIIQPVMTLFGCSASIRMMHAEKSIANAVILLRLPDYIFFCYPLNYVHIVAYGDN